jgi:hypothetical protein
MPEDCMDDAMKPLETADVIREEANLLRSQGASPSFSALCISGGGIRSATFGLGAIQGLAERGLLQQFDYLSTVSGGGYIGSWLTMWATRAGGVGKIVPKLKADGCMSEHDPIGHLREYNSYLSPTVGAVSSDLWTLVATVLRNVLLNWLVLVPLLLAILTIPRAYLTMLTLPERLFGAEVFAGPTPDYAAPALDAISGSPLVWLVLPVASLVLLAITFFNTVRYLPGIGGEPHTRFEYLARVEGPLVSAVLTYLLYDSLYYVGRAFVDETPILSQMLWTMVACGAGWIAFLFFYDKRPRHERLKLLFGWITVTIAAGAATAGAATWVITNVVLWNVNASLTASWATYVTFGPPLILCGLLLGTILTSGLASGVLEDEDREWLARGNAGLLLAGVGWLALCTVVLQLPEWVLAWRTWGAGFLSVGGGIAAWLSRAQPPAPTNVNPGAAVAKPNRVLALAASAAPLVFVTLLAIALSIATNMLIVAVHALIGAPLTGPHGEMVTWQQHQAVQEQSPVAVIALLALVFLATSWFMSRYVNINTFSLHGMYRDRLIRAYLGASNPTRRPNPFTGFDRDDDAPLWRLRGTRPFPRGERDAEPRADDAPRLAAAEGGVVHDDAAALRQRGARLPRFLALWRRGVYRHRGGDFRRRREPEHGVSLVAARRLHHDAVQRAPRVMARQPRQGGCARVEGCGAAVGDRLTREGGARPDLGEQQVRVSLRRRALRKPRPLRDDSPPLPLHRRAGFRMRSAVHVRGSRKRAAENPDRFRRLDRSRRGAGARGGRSRASRGRRHHRVFRR